METAISKAKKNGAGFVSVRNSNHFGISGYYSMMALKEDLIGFSTTNSNSYVVPTFGREGMVGTNPLSFAVPALTERAFVLDMSTAVATLGKLEVAHRMGKRIPPGWAVDENGLSCDDPGRILHNLKNRVGGGILPLGGGAEESGGHKGYGLDSLADILSGVLSGSGYLNLVYPQTPEGKALPARIGHFFGAWRVDYFRPVVEFKKDMDDFIRRLKNSAKARGHARIYVHGEKEFELEEKYEKNGLPLYSKVYEDLAAIGREVGVDFNL
jgi:L-2-hydroxycarboxylate dehydrogenase (NAD+)